MSIIKRRLSPEASRAAALEAARLILVEDGPQAVTLKAVAARMGRTHANLLHHFGTAAELQKALAANLANHVCELIAGVVFRARKGEADPRLIVDLTFDAFNEQGAGALASWMILTGNEDALDPILDAIHRLMDQLHEGNESGEEEKEMHQDTLTMVLMALGDALLGAPMAKALGLPRETAREMAFQQLQRSPRVAARLGLA